jgi:CheY-like chemotaxis protein/HPt (histidine-containing phosphotransfer) domain-containing protein
MGGKMFLESEVNSGSAFTFEINYPAGSAERMQSTHSSEHIDGSILNGLKILLTDDNEHNQIVARDTLQSKASVEITEAVNGREAIEMLTYQDIDVILMDVQMPVMDGYEATRYIREKLPAPKNQVPIIALTASVIRSDLDKCKKAGMNDYVPKPFKTYQLITTIAKATGREIKYKDVANREPKKVTGISEYSTDLSYLEEFCEGDPVKVRKYINLFLQSAPMLIKNLTSSLHNNNYTVIANQLHGFKMKWLMMGMQEAHELAQEIEDECREEKVDGLFVTKETTQLMKLIKSAIQELRNL